MRLQKMSMRKKKSIKCKIISIKKKKCSLANITNEKKNINFIKKKQ